MNVENIVSCSTIECFLIELKGSAESLNNSFTKKKKWNLRSQDATTVPKKTHLTEKIFKLIPIDISVIYQIL